MSAHPLPTAATTMRPSALIAEDEPLLAQALVHELAAAWPQLHIAATVGDGLSAVREALTLLPNLLFFDVRMPGLNGLDAAADIADQWPSDVPLPLLVFITAYDEYAVQAFERAAVDYLLKPLQSARLRQSLERIKPLAQKNNAQAATNSVASILPDPAHTSLQQPATTAQLAQRASQRCAHAAAGAPASQRGQQHHFGAHGRCAVL